MKKSMLVLLTLVPVAVGLVVNFTLPNVVLHVAVFSVLVFVFWAAREKEQ